VWQAKKTTITEFGYLILVCNGVKVTGILKFQNSGENQYGSSNSWILSSIFVILTICQFFPELLPKLKELMPEFFSKFFQLDY
jgi:hypothetical protein